MADPSDVVKAETPPTEFSGTPGLPLFGGWLYDEKDVKLQGQRRYTAYLEMEANHPIISVALQMAATACASVAWRVVPASPDDPTALRAADLLTASMEELRCGLTPPGVRGGGWATLVEEQAAALRDGFQLHETSYRRTPLGWLWDRFEVRRSSTVQQWMTTAPDGGGDLLGVYQQTPTQRTYMPAERLIHVIGRRNGGNPEGQSLLRPLWSSYRSQRDLMWINNVGMSRNLAGYPVFQVPAAVYNDPTVRARFEDFIRKVRIDEQQGAVIPAETDSQGQPTGYKFGLMAIAGNKGDSPLPMIQFYESRIAIGLLVQFLLLGAGGSGGTTGSYSLSSSHTSQHAAFLGAFLDRIAEANQIEANRLADLNGIPPEARPRLVHGDIEKIDLGELGTFLDVMSRAGIPLGDPAAVSHLREIGGLPPVDATGEKL